MSTTPDIVLPLERKIEEADVKLLQLQAAVTEIGFPAATDLQHRLDLLRIEANALKRNFEESIRRGEPDLSRFEKIEALLAHIEREEISMAHDAAFLHQAAPSSMALLAEMGMNAVNLINRGLKLIEQRTPLGSSVFVNHSHDNLVEFHGLQDESKRPDSEVK